MRDLTNGGIWQFGILAFLVEFFFWKTASWSSVSRWSEYSKVFDCEIGFTRENRCQNAKDVQKIVCAAHHDENRLADVLQSSQNRSQTENHITLMFRPQNRSISCVKTGE